MKSTLLAAVALASIAGLVPVARGDDVSTVFAFTFNMNSKSPGSDNAIKALINEGFPEAALETSQFVALTIQESPEEGEYKKIRLALEERLLKFVTAKAKAGGARTDAVPGAYTPLADGEFEFAGFRLLLEMEHSPNVGGHIAGIVKAKTTTRFLLYCVDPHVTGHVLPLARPLYEGSITYGKATFGAAIHVAGQALPILVAGAHLPAGFNLWFEESFYVPKRVADIHASLETFSELWAGRPAGFGDFEAPRPVDPALVAHGGGGGGAPAQALNPEEEESSDMDGDGDEYVEDEDPSAAPAAARKRMGSKGQALSPLEDDPIEDGMDSTPKDGEANPAADVPAAPGKDASAEKMDPEAVEDPMSAPEEDGESHDENPDAADVEVDGDVAEIQVRDANSEVEAFLDLFRRVLLIGDLNFRLRYDPALFDDVCVADGQPVCAERGSDQAALWLRKIILSTQLYSPCKPCQKKMRTTFMNAIAADPAAVYRKHDSLLNIRSLVLDDPRAGVPPVQWRSDDHKDLVKRMFPVPIAPTDLPAAKFPLPTFSRVVGSTPCVPGNLKSLTLCFQGAVEAERKTAIDGAERGSMRVTYGKGENIPAWTEALVFFGAEGAVDYSHVLSGVTISDHVPLAVRVRM